MSALAAGLDVDLERGLTSAEAARRVVESGPNQLKRVKQSPPLVLLVRQFTNAMVLVLAVAGVVTALTGEVTDTIVIGIIVVLNGVVGFVQEYRAQRALEALQRLEGDEVVVRRDGVLVRIRATDVTLGDVIELATGDVVPADLRLIEAHNLRIAQAALTGESESASKSTEPLHGDGVPSVGDRHNMAFQGTAVTFGRGAGVVIAVGGDTELGLIADLLTQRTEVPTPLQARLSSLARLMASGALGICGLIFIIGLLRGEPLREMFVTSVSLAVAAIPEGLPAVITVSLALGARRMAERHALVRKLVAVETLGSVDVICTDKTGTLTQNRMQVVRVWTPLGEYLVTGSGYSTEGELLGPQAATTDPYVQRVAVIAALCNDASLRAPTQLNGSWELAGDPTEGALVALAGKCGVDAASLRVVRPRVQELPFDAERRLMTTLHRAEVGYQVLTKGALESVTSALVADDTESDIAREVLERWTKEGFRVLAMADASITTPGAHLEENLNLVGLVAITDPPRAEVEGALIECRGAGIRTVIITGDHPATAAAVAGWIGLRVTEQEILSGDELARLDDAELQARVRDVSVYARVSPADKLRIVDAWQCQGAVVAMTGDGVNDAPALRKADIGIAMGITGTDVSKEAADMVIADDNFATIVSAVEEGRRIYDNIRRVIRYLLSTNVGELWVMFLAPLVGMPLPLLAVQILWMNLVTDGLPAIALGLEPLEPAAMQRHPRSRGESLFARGLWQHVLWVGLFMATIVLTLEGLSRAAGWPWQTMVFTTLSLLQLAHSVAVRSEQRSVFRMSMRTNRWLYASVLATFVVQMMVVYVGPLQKIFHTGPLSLVQLGVVLVASSSVLFAVEVEKLLLRK
ncbi:MAG: cation-translocating P-type ATPase [Acidimicrobiales bacterium]